MSSEQKSLYQKVHEAYMNALDNEHTLDMQDPVQVASDMFDTASLLEDVDMSQFNGIVECIRAIQSRRRLQG